MSFENSAVWPCCVPHLKFAYHTAHQYTFRNEDVVGSVAFD